MAINELDALCVALPPDLCPFTDANELRYLAAVNIEGLGWRPVGRNLPFQPPSFLIRSICAERAVDTVTGSVLVDGRRVTPEAYLRRWRVRLAEPLTLRELVSARGVRAWAVFSWHHSATLASLQARWTHAPYPSFGALLQARGLAIPPDGGPGAAVATRLQVDLTQPDAARDAWWIDDFLNALDQDKHLVIRRIEFSAEPAASRALDQREIQAGNQPMGATA